MCFFWQRNNRLEYVVCRLKQQLAMATCACGAFNCTHQKEAYRHHHDFLLMSTHHGHGKANASFSPTQTRVLNHASHIHVQKTLKTHCHVQAPSFPLGVIARERLRDGLQGLALMPSISILQTAPFWSLRNSSFLSGERTNSSRLTSMQNMDLQGTCQAFDHVFSWLSATVTERCF